MNHKVNSVQQLYDDAKKMHDVVVLEKADGIINNLNQAINQLKSSWEGKDAGVQINNVVDVYNAMTKIRNTLVELAKDSSLVASNYREIQNANRANLETLAPITSEGEKLVMEPYEDNRDTINITAEAVSGKHLLDSVNEQYDDFKESVNRCYNAIMDNWQAGPNRDKAQTAFGEFMTSSNKYKEILQDVSQSITDALKNYSM